jgi:hypothetical protein
MVSEPTTRVARVDKRELADMPASWTNCQRGRHLRALLRLKGIDPNRLYTVEYYPYRSCWVLIQMLEPRLAMTTLAVPAQEAEAFYLQAISEFRRAARLAFAAAAARSRHFAVFGCPYELPAKIQEITPADLRELIGSAGEEKASVRFNDEGGWQTEPSAN